MKKVVNVVLSLLIVFALIGCSSNSKQIQDEVDEVVEVVNNNNDNNEPTIEETIVDDNNKQEETPINNKEETLDPSKYDYWVVFYDQYGNELQRTVEHYGTTPIYKQVLPTGFIKWTYKKTGKDVDTFKPITTNTYFEAVCNSNSRHSSNDQISAGDVIRIPSEADGYDLYYILKMNQTEATLVNINCSVETYFSTSSTDYENSLLDVACNTTFYNNLSSTLQDAIIEKTIDLNEYDSGECYSIDELRTIVSSKQFIKSINRKVYALDFTDFEDIINSVDSIDDIAVITGGDCWYRSISDYVVWELDDGDGRVGLSYPESISNPIKPAFVVNLSDITCNKYYDVSLSQLSGGVMIRLYVPSNTSITDVDMSDIGIPGFVTKTYGPNTICLLDLDGAYVFVFLKPLTDLTNIFSHDELIALEELITDEMRGGDPADLDQYYGGATQWSEVTSEYDLRMLFDVIYTSFFIEDCYDDNSSTYDQIITRLSPYFVPTNYVIKSETPIYTTFG